MSTLILFLYSDENLTEQNNNVYIRYAAYNKSHYKNLFLRQLLTAIAHKLNFKSITIPVRIHLRFSKDNSNMVRFDYLYR